MGQITLKQITKSFGDIEVVHPTNLTVEDGEFVLFGRPSGCGKSTLLRLIAGLEDVNSGQIGIDGNDAIGKAGAGDDVLVLCTVSAYVGSQEYWFSSKDGESASR